MRPRRSHLLIASLMCSTAAVGAADASVTITAPYHSTSIIERADPDLTGLGQSTSRATADRGTGAAAVTTTASEESPTGASYDYGRYRIGNTWALARGGVTHDIPVSGAGTYTVTMVIDQIQASVNHTTWSVSGPSLPNLCGSPDWGCGYTELAMGWTYIGGAAYVYHYPCGLGLSCNHDDYQFDIEPICQRFCSGVSQITMRVTLTTSYPGPSTIRVSAGIEAESGAKGRVSSSSKASGVIRSIQVDP